MRHLMKKRAKTRYLDFYYSKRHILWSFFIISLACLYTYYVCSLKSTCTQELMLRWCKAWQNNLGLNEIWTQVARRNASECMLISGGNDNVLQDEHYKIVPNYHLFELDSSVLVFMVNTRPQLQRATSQPPVISITNWWICSFCSQFQRKQIASFPVT